jgi:hypothetical protein
VGLRTKDEIRLTVDEKGMATVLADNTRQLGGHGARRHGSGGEC